MNQYSMEGVGLMSAWKAGEVVWFDESSGEGMIIDTEDGRTYYVHYSAIQSKKKFKTLQENKKVKFVPYKKGLTRSVEKIIEN